MLSFCELYKISESACQSILSHVLSIYVLPDLSDREEPRRLTSVASVHSFDIFDTVLARSVAEPEDIFSLVEEHFPCPNFRSVRLYAATLSSGSFDAVYDTMLNITRADPSYIQNLKEIEFAMELKHSYLIEQNYRRVADGDILVSDMYLPFDRLWTLLRAAGFNKSVNLFVSPSGKATGWMWESLTAVYDIKSHLGDSYLSDVGMARKYQVRGEHSTVHALRAMEKRLHSRGGSSSALALLLRRMRHRNPYPTNSVESALFDEQVEVNLPVLLLFAQNVYDLMVAEGLQRLLLTMRDCCLLEKIFAAFYPEVEAIPFYIFSTMYRNPTREFMDYVTRIYVPGSTLIIDFGGAFKSGRDLFSLLFNQLPRVHLLIFNSTRAPQYENLTFVFRADDDVAFAGLNLEILNADVRGSLVDVCERSRFEVDIDSSDEGVAEVVLARHPIKYRMEYVRVNHDAIDLFCATANSSLVRHHLRQLATEKTDGGGALSTALLHDAMKEVSHIKDIFIH